MESKVKRAIAASIIGLGAVLLILAFVGRRGDDSHQPPDILKRRLDKLESIPYTTRTEHRVDEKAAGVLVHMPEEAYRGYNIYSSIESFRVNLMDMAGNIVHTWSYPHNQAKFWTRVVMLDDGAVVLTEKFRSLLKLDWQSNLVWRKEMQAHHDFAILPDGTFYVIVREIRTYRGLKVRFPAIARLTSSGDEIDRWRTYDHLDEIKRKFDRRSFLDTILDSILAVEDSAAVFENLQSHQDMRKLKLGTKFYDYFHLNNITILPDNPLGRADSRFAGGNLLICFRNVNQIAILEKDTKEVLWVWGEGVLEWPHHPTMVEGGNILVFDNGVERRYSKVLELNPITEAIEWEYTADPPTIFYTYQKGSAQRLPNGNTLICEGDMGRAFEVTRGGEIVWEWINPEAKDGRRAQVYRMTRLAPEMVEPLLEKP